MNDNTIDTLKIELVSTTNKANETINRFAASFKTLAAVSEAAAKLLAELLQRLKE